MNIDINDVKGYILNALSFEAARREQEKLNYTWRHASMCGGVKDPSGQWVTKLDQLVQMVSQAVEIQPFSSGVEGYPDIFVLTLSEDWPLYPVQVSRAQVPALYYNEGRVVLTRREEKGVVLIGVVCRKADHEDFLQRGGKISLKIFPPQTEEEAGKFQLWIAGVDVSLWDAVVGNASDDEIVRLFYAAPAKEQKQQPAEAKRAFFPSPYEGARKYTPKKR